MLEQEQKNRKTGANRQNGAGRLLEDVAEPSPAERADREAPAALLMRRAARMLAQATWKTGRQAMRAGGAFARASAVP